MWNGGTVMQLYILGCYGTTPIDRLIRAFTNHEISHIAIQVSNKFVVESGWHGVNVSKILNKTYRKFKFKNLDIETERKIYEYILDTIDIKYDKKLFLAIGINTILEKLGLIEFFRKKYNKDIKLHWDDPTKLICVEGIVEACRNAGGFELIPDIKDEDIVPGHITVSPYIEEVFE
jgi:hypothetical protein